MTTNNYQTEQAIGYSTNCSASGSSLELNLQKKHYAWHIYFSNIQILFNSINNRRLEKYHI